MTPVDRLMVGAAILAVCGHVALVRLFTELLGGALDARRLRREGAASTPGP